jgi:hypothetical protein
MWRTAVANHLKNLALVALTLWLIPASKAESTNLSADATAAYINTTLHKYPTLEFVASGCSGDEQTLSISEDRRSVIIKQNFALPTEGGRCDNIQTLTVPIFNLHLDAIGSWAKRAQHASFYLNCTNAVECFSRRPDAHSTPSGEYQWLLEVTAPDQVCDRLKKAIQHLIASLLTEADAHVASNDPFAKHPH